jgi:hypothetical protein
VGSLKTTVLVCFIHASARRHVEFALYQTKILAIAVVADDGLRKFKFNLAQAYMAKLLSRMFGKIFKRSFWRTVVLKNGEMSSF